MSSTGWIAPSSAAARCNGMELLDKLAILTDAAKYDAACTSSGVRRSARPGMIGNTTSSIAGCCHSFSADGRCVSLLKVLMTNRCVYDCKYCVNRRSNEAKRAMFTPEELAETRVGETPAEANGWGILDHGVGSLEKVHVVNGRTVDVDMGQETAYVYMAGKRYRLRGDVLTEED